MANIATNLFEAVDLLIDKKLQTSSFGTAVVGEILSKKTSRIYQVRYQDLIFEAEALSSVHLKESDIVYLFIPTNDMSAKKFIIGVTSGFTPAIETEEEIDYIITHDIDGLKKTIASLNLRLEEIEKDIDEGTSIEFATTEDIESLFSQTQPEIKEDDINE